MSETIKKALVALKDIQGIQGSFVLNADGALLAMEMPSLFDASLFKDVGPRIERLAESFSSFGDEFESCVIRFSDHMLCIRQFVKGGALCILTNSTVNLPALKMAMNLTHRRIADEVANAPALNGTAVPASALPAAPVNGSATSIAAMVTEPVAPAASLADEGNGYHPPERRTQRFYRGHPVED